MENWLAKLIVFSPLIIMVVLYGVIRKLQHISEQLSGILHELQMSPDEKQAQWKLRAGFDAIDVYPPEANQKQSSR